VRVPSSSRRTIGERKNIDKAVSEKAVDEDQARE
jgi:hypothetical protein